MISSIHRFFNGHSFLLSLVLFAALHVAGVQPIAGQTTAPGTNNNNNTTITLPFEKTNESMMVFLAIGVSQWVSCYVISILLFNPKVVQPNYKFVQTSEKMTVSFIEILRHAYSEQPLFMRRIIDAFFVKALFYFIAFSAGFYSGRLMSTEGEMKIGRLIVLFIWCLIILFMWWCLVILVVNE